MCAAQEYIDVWHSYLQSAAATSALFCGHRHDAVHSSKGTQVSRATGAVSPKDIERYKAQFSEPGALTAALNYYRAMVCLLPASCIPSFQLQLHCIVLSSARTLCTSHCYLRWRTQR